MKINQIDFSAWKAEFTKCHTSNYFVSPDWLDIQSRVFKLKNLFFKINKDDSDYFLSFQEKNGELYSNFIAYGGFMTKDGQRVDAGILKKALQIIEKDTGLSIARIKLSPLTIYEGDNFSFKTSETALLMIFDNSIDQNKIIDKKTRNMVKKSSLNDIIIKPISPNDLSVFYKFYCATMDRVGSKYYTPIELFEYFCWKGDVNFLGAYLEGELIAGSVFMNCGTVKYYWRNSSSQKGR